VTSARWPAALEPEPLLLRFANAVMNNPARIAWQRRGFRPAAGACVGGTTLEIGCGGGGSVGRILEYFGADRVVAVDSSPTQIDMARDKYAARYADRVTFAVGDGTKLAFGDNDFDSVLALGVLHDIVDWRTALSEIARVLKPTGRFYFEEPFVPNILGTHLPWLIEWHEWMSAAAGLAHPHFTAREFLASCEKVGLLARDPLRRFGIMGMGVAVKSVTGEPS
jgi:ubiquinone/menaquinone biosynthesis C-methylase UbiE